MPVIDKPVSVVEAGQILGVHCETVKRMCREGRIPASKVHNMWLIDQDDLAEFAAGYNDPHRGRRRQNTATDR